MPCSTGQGDPGAFSQSVIYSDPRDKEKIRRLEAILCGLLANYGEEALAGVHWERAGVSEGWARLWWKQHQVEDAIKRKKEAALAKLTPEERTLLGV